MYHNHAPHGQCSKTPYHLALHTCQYHSHQQYSPLWDQRKSWDSRRSSAFIRAAPADVFRCAALLELAARGHADVVAQTGVAFAAAGCVLCVTAAWCILGRNFAVGIVAY